MIEIGISSELAEKVPELKLSCIECNVLVQEKNENLWVEIQEEIKQLAKQLEVEDISRLPAISASRLAYKKCGKDPARYRLSSEALLRRVLKRGEIYQINNVVDVLNLVSISSGYSIGGYDAHKIEGKAEFGIGKTNEPYVGIGRGELNIEFMPVFRDATGAFGTPTSDSERTCVSAKTKRFLMIIIDYGSKTELLNQATKKALVLLEKYAGASKIETRQITYEGL